MADDDAMKPGEVDACGDACCGSTIPLVPPSPERSALIREALRLEWLTVAWMIVEGAVAVAAGVTGGSLTLLAFGDQIGGGDRTNEWERRAGITGIPGCRPRR